MSLLTIGGYGHEPFKEITNGNETPRTTTQKSKTIKTDLSFAPKKTNMNESPTQLSATGRRLQFEDENTLQAIPLKGSKGVSSQGTTRKISSEDISPPPNEMYDRSKCARKKYQKDQVVSFFENVFSHSSQAEGWVAQPEEQTLSTPQKKIPLLFGANVTLDSPDPLSKYHSFAPRPTHVVTSLSRVLHETKYEQSPDGVTDDIYDFTIPTSATSKAQSSTSKYKGSSIADVIRGNLIEECDAEHQPTAAQTYDHEKENTMQHLPFQPKQNSLHEDEDQLFQQMTSHRKKKTTKALPLQPLSSEGAYFIPRPTLKTTERNNGKSIDSALSSLPLDSSSAPQTRSLETLSGSISSEDLLTNKRPTPPSCPPTNKRFSRPTPPSSSTSPSSLSNSWSLSSLESLSPTNSPEEKVTARPPAGKSRPLCGRKFSMAPKAANPYSENGNDRVLEDSLESFSIPQPSDLDPQPLTTGAAEGSAGAGAGNHSWRRRVVISGVSKQAMKYLLLQANKKRRRRGKIPTTFNPKFEAIPEDAMIALPPLALPYGNIRLENALTLTPSIPPEYVSWMIDEYMTLADEDEEDNEDQAQERNNDEGEGGGGYHEEEEGEEEEKRLLFQSIKNYNTKVFKEITSRNPSCISYRDDKGNTPLILATIVGWRKAIKILIRNGSDLDAQNHKGNTCCHYAFILPNYTDIQRYFYRKKANFTIVNEKNFNCKYQQLPFSASSPSLASGVGKGKARE